MPFSYNEYMQRKTQIQRNISFIPGPEGPPGAQGPKGDTGPTGPVTYTIVPPLSSLNCYTMPLTQIDQTDLLMEIPDGQNIPFTTLGVVAGPDIRNVSPYAFLIKSIGYYQVFYQISITGYGKVVLTTNSGTEYKPSCVSTDMTTNIGYLTCSTLINITTPNTIISLKNITSDILYLNVIDDDSLMTNILITKIQT
jgi:hypothetical protein